MLNRLSNKHCCLDIIVWCLTIMIMGSFDNFVNDDCRVTILKCCKFVLGVELLFLVMLDEVAQSSYEACTCF